MEKHSTSAMALLLAISAVSLPDAMGKERQHGPMNPSTSVVETASGIRTDRLSPRQRRVWAAIERIVLSRDSSGRFSHPRLQSLWQWAAASGSVVQVEFPNPKAPGDHQAGRFQIEKSSADGVRHEAVIRLCLPVIDRALVRKRRPGNVGFIRFEGLRKEQRYAEILGHELAHAVWILGDREHARQVEALDREIDELEGLRSRGTRGVGRDEQTIQRLRRLESLIGATERPAEEAEEKIWRELSRDRLE